MNIVIKNIYLAQKKNIAGDGGQTHERLVWSPTPYRLPAKNDPAPPP